MDNETVAIDSAAYVEELERQLGRMTVEAIKLRAVIRTLVAKAIELEGEYQTDERGELVELEEEADV